MALDSDVADFALLGTGVAPLVAATHLLAQGKSVLILNPDWDFFREDSELPLDPLWPVSSRNVTPQRLARNSPEHALQQLRPDFPGAIELWSGPETGGAGYRDAYAPHVRQRARLWISSGELARARGWETMEDMYVETSDAGLNPQLLEGPIAAKRFPGIGRQEGTDDLRGLLLPKLSDVDVNRYRNGLLEFVRERLGPKRVICAATQVEPIAEGVRFHSGGAPRTARLNEGMLVFWTPRLSQWVLTQAQTHGKKSETPLVNPTGVRLWEEWMLNSREPLDPGIVGVFEGMTAWAELEGAPDPRVERLFRLAVLRAGPLVPLSGLNVPQSGMTWASAESFASLSRLSHGFLGWERFSISSMRPRAVLEWKDAIPHDSAVCWAFSRGSIQVKVVSGCDGPIVDVVRTARLACGQGEIL